MGEGKNLVGVDIGASGVKVCQVRESRRGLGLVRLGFVPLGSQAIVDGQVMDQAAVIDALQRAFAEAKIRQKECAVSVSGQSVIIRKITIPMMSDAQLGEQIQWEAEQHIPFDIKDVQVDYQVLRKRPETSQMDLLLVAAKRDQIEDYAQLARSAKLKPVVCDIDAFTVQNLFEYSRGLPPDQTIALINVGASLSSLNIISNGVSAFTREIANGGNVIGGDPAAALRALRPGGSLQMRRDGGSERPEPRRHGPPAGRADRGGGVRLDRGRNPAQPRFLRGDQRRGRDLAHLRYGRHGEPRRARCRDPAAGARSGRGVGADREGRDRGA